MIMMSLRDGGFLSKQSPVARGDIVPFGDCFATCARNDMQGDALREVQSAGGEELRPLFGRTLMASILDKAFKGEL